MTILSRNPPVERIAAANTFHEFVRPGPPPSLTFFVSLDLGWF
jgi:hypothetical protein